MITKVENMPDMPSPYLMRDWKQVSIRYDGLVFDEHRQGDFFPLIWRDLTGHNGVPETFGLPSYLGMKRGGDRHEAVNTAAAVLGATLTGLDKRTGGADRVVMLEAYFNTDNGEHLFLNRTDLRSGRTFWYEIYPHILLYSLAYYYPGAGKLDDIMLETADQWLSACRALKDESGLPDFNHLAFSFETMQPVDNGRWKEPEGAAGVAWLQLMAYIRWGGQERLEAAEECLLSLEQRGENPFYEILLPYGAYAAARMNAQHGRSFDMKMLVNWCFDGDSACRPGWGIVAERWGDYDCHGLCGSLTDWGQRWDAVKENAGADYDPERSGYAFAANTFSLAAALVPLVRYDSRFAHDIGKWMLNAANAARLFYPTFLPGKQQSCSFYIPDEDDVIAYEGLRKWWDYQSPYATGDPIRYSWGGIDLGLYGSSHVGLFGGIIEKTEVEGILQLDCLRTDYYREEAFPTYLYFNPFNVPVTVNVIQGAADLRVYDAAAHRLLPGDSRQLKLPPSSAVLAVIIPQDGTLTDEGSIRRCNGIVIDYQTGA
ncbi:hypothetical protein [Paenibacillus sp. FSL E2-0201]|uniref:hypothetical protein n=1 Tax=unclassified Paenibacillus TaxID=185978 RepID=UPI0030D70105